MRSWMVYFGSATRFLQTVEDTPGGTTLTFTCLFSRCSCLGAQIFGMPLEAGWILGSINSKLPIDRIHVFINNLHGINKKKKKCSTSVNLLRFDKTNQGFSL